MSDADYSRMVHAIFRGLVFEFARQPTAPSLAQWLRERFWPQILATYRKLEHPPDPRQRILTPYSYLRCIPYEFLNEFHQNLVSSTLERLPERERAALAAYFFHFFTEPASADSLGVPMEEYLSLLRQSLTKLLIHDRLVYCLLRQIERY